MNIQDRFLKRGFPFELNLAADGSNCFITSAGEVIKNLARFKLEATCFGDLTLTLKGYKTDVDGKTLEAENGAVPSYSRSFLVSPGESAGNRIVLIVEKEAASETIGGWTLSATEDPEGKES